MTSKEKADKLDALYAAYLAKLDRLCSLKGQGRYGYQLRMPHKAVRIAADKLRAFCEEIHVSTEGML